MNSFKTYAWQTGIRFKPSVLFTRPNYRNKNCFALKTEINPCGNLEGGSKGPLSSSVTLGKFKSFRNPTDYLLNYLLVINFKHNSKGNSVKV